VNRRVAVAAAADIVAIVVFVAIGRRNHNEGTAVDGVVTVAAPFLIALATGWVAAQAWKRPMQVAAAFIIWPVTVAVGLVLRRFVFDRGTALPFIIVATLVNGAFLVGWRMAATRVQGGGR
jgi:Protein of unknown function (DUF3054)